MKTANGTAAELMLARGARLEIVLALVAMRGELASSPAIDDAPPTLRETVMAQPTVRSGSTLVSAR